MKIVQIDVICDESCDEAMYVDSTFVINGSIGVMDVVKVADGGLIDMRWTKISWVHEEWPDSLQDALACVEEP